MSEQEVQAAQLRVAEWLDPDCRIPFRVGRSKGGLWRSYLDGHAPAPLDANFAAAVVDAMGAKGYEWGVLTHVQRKKKYDVIFEHAKTMDLGEVVDTSWTHATVLAADAVRAKEQGE